MNIKIYGCRGSLPVSSEAGSAFGGNTSCIRLVSGGSAIIVDAGSGIYNLQKDIDKNIPIHVLISHLHIDHIIGLSSFNPLFTSGPPVSFYTANRNANIPLAEQIFGIFKPPYWPVDLAKTANASCVSVTDGTCFNIGSFCITPFLASHADMTISYHITDGKKTVVHLLDSETAAMSAAEYARLVDFCKDADLVIFDSVCAPKDYEKYRGWGHSTVLDGIKLRRDTNCALMLFAHFSQNYSDEEIYSWRRYFDDGNYVLAKDGLEIAL